MSGTTARRVEWADITLGEFDALTILRASESVPYLNAYWDDIAAYDLCGDGTPNRLSDSGAVWLRNLRCEAFTDDAETARRIARDFLSSMGTLLTANVARVIRAEW